MGGFLACMSLMLLHKTCFVVAVHGEQIDQSLLGGLLVYMSLREHNMCFAVFPFAQQTALKLEDDHLVCHLGHLG